jgi:hypothetical protein
MLEMVLKPQAIRTASLVIGLNVALSLIGLATIPAARPWWILAALIAPGLWTFFEIKGRVLRALGRPEEQIDMLRRGFGVVVSGAGVAAAAYSVYLLVSTFLEWEASPDQVLRRYFLAVLGIFYIWAGNGIAKQVQSHDSQFVETERQHMRRFIGWAAAVAGVVALAAALLFPEERLDQLTRFGTLPLCALVIGRRLYARVRIMLAE